MQTQTSKDTKCDLARRALQFAIHAAVCLTDPADSGMERRRPWPGPRGDPGSEMRQTLVGRRRLEADLRARQVHLQFRNDHAGRRVVEDGKAGVEEKNVGERACRHR